jgi:hypothetical protein
VEVGFNGKAVAGGILGRVVSCDESGKSYLGGVSGALTTMMHNRVRKEISKTTGMRGRAGKIKSRFLNI